MSIHRIIGGLPALVYKSRDYQHIYEMDWIEDGAQNWNLTNIGAARLASEAMWPVVLTGKRTDANDLYLTVFADDESSDDVAVRFVVARLTPWGCVIGSRLPTLISGVKEVRGFRGDDVVEDHLFATLSPGSPAPNWKRYYVDGSADVQTQDDDLLPVIGDEGINVLNCFGKFADYLFEGATYTSVADGGRPDVDGYAGDSVEMSRWGCEFEVKFTTTDTAVQVGQADKDFPVYAGGSDPADAGVWWGVYFTSSSDATYPNKILVSHSSKSWVDTGITYVAGKYYHVRVEVEHRQVGNPTIDTWVDGVQVGTDRNPFSSKIWPAATTRGRESMFIMSFNKLPPAYVTDLPPASMNIRRMVNWCGSDWRAANDGSKLHLVGLPADRDIAGTSKKQLPVSTFLFPFMQELDRLRTAQNQISYAELSQYSGRSQLKRFGSEVLVPALTWEYEEKFPEYHRTRLNLAASLLFPQLDVLKTNFAIMKNCESYQIYITELTTRPGSARISLPDGKKNTSGVADFFYYNQYFRYRANWINFVEFIRGNGIEYWDVEFYHYHSVTRGAGATDSLGTTWDALFTPTSIRTILWANDVIGSLPWEDGPDLVTPSYELGVDYIPQAGGGAGITWISANQPALSADYWVAAPGNGFYRV